MSKKSLSSFIWTILTIANPTLLWFSISMNFILNLPPSNLHNYILVMVNHFTMMVHFIPCTKTIIISLLNTWTRNPILVLTYSHFLGLSFRFTSLNFNNTNQRCSKWSSQVMLCMLRSSTKTFKNLSIYFPKTSIMVLKTY